MSNSKSFVNVAKLLVLRADAALPAEGAVPSALADGAVGVYDARTGRAITAADAPNTREFFLAVGKGAHVGGEAPDIIRSAGQSIQKGAIREYNARCYTPGQQKVLQISGIQSACGTDFGFKVDISNNEVLRTIGFQKQYKYFSAETDPCTGCEDCPSDNGKELVNRLYNAVNNDPDGFFTAYRISNVDGTTILTDGVLWDNYDADASGAPQLRIEVNAQAVAQAAGINYMYFYPRELDINIYATFGSPQYMANFTVSEITPLRYEQGSSYDVRQMEYVLEGQDGNPGPFRVTDSGVVLGTQHTVVDGVKYIMITLGYDNYTSSGLLNHMNPIGTVIAIPCTYTTVTPALMALLDALIEPQGFGGLADYVAACDCDSVNTPTDPDANPATADLGDSGADEGEGGVA